MRAKFNEFNTIRHDLGRFPLVDLYGLWQFKYQQLEWSFWIYYDPTDFSLVFDNAIKEIPGLRDSGSSSWGIPLSQVLQEYGYNVEDKNVLGNVFNDFFKDDGYIRKYMIGKIEHGWSPWIQNQFFTPISVLKEQGLWDDIRLLFIPIRIEGGLLSLGGSVQIAHLDYDRLVVNATTTNTALTHVDLMMLLRS